MTTGSSLALAGSYFVAKNKYVDDENMNAILAGRASAKRRDYEWQIVWRNVLAFIYLHAGFIYGFYLIFTGRTRLWTPVFAELLMGSFPKKWLREAMAEICVILVYGCCLWGPVCSNQQRPSTRLIFITSCVVFSLLSAMGVTVGAHRLWAHRAYRARWPMRLVLALLQTMAFQNHIYEWVRDHRVHHKYTETDADPHNAKRGFFFSHIGWLMVRKHKEVFEKGAAVDMSDLEKDPIVMFQKKTYLVVMPIFCFLLPTWVPVYFWGEDPWTAWYVASIWRYTLSLNFTWLVNSAAHIWGNKPFDKNIGATDNVTVAICAMGEGWHNYHHVFPWDYKAAELGNYRTNVSTAVIDFAAKHGWAYDLKTVSAQMIRNRVARTGDGSHPSVHEAAKLVSDEDDHHHPENAVWGWDDRDMPDEDRALVEISHQKLD